MAIVQAQSPDSQDGAVGMAPSRGQPGPGLWSLWDGRGRKAGKANGAEMLDQERNPAEQASVLTGTAGRNRLLGHGREARRPAWVGDLGGGMRIVRSREDHACSRRVARTGEQAGEQGT